MKIWLTKAGGVYQKLKVVNLYPGYRGVIATKRIQVYMNIMIEKITYCIYPKIITNNIRNGLIKPLQ